MNPSTNQNKEAQGNQENPIEINDSDEKDELALLTAKEKGDKRKRENPPGHLSQKKDLECPDCAAGSHEIANWDVQVMAPESMDSEVDLRTGNFLFNQVLKNTDDIKTTWSIVDMCAALGHSRE
jgi:hypothetical protein